ncbi:eukaryotic aspartyl protease family protein [Striga asiatica]|uniref:Eukaryotic aspartyl protease family protein n=1 Tax=Striga asiatica TaxID=4170 RepID=A0A5A7NW83_STRAF|nr:eukaryotic aspartyl protease family protein [Striga asiatica]
MVKIGNGSVKPGTSHPSFKSYNLYMDTAVICFGCNVRGVGDLVADASCRKSPFTQIRGRALTIPSFVISIDYVCRISASTFRFGKIEVLKSLVFGCGLDNRKNYGDNGDNKFSGIMGLGWGSYSILDQANLLTEGCSKKRELNINNKKLKVSDQDFRLRDDGTGGCIIDSGTPFSWLIKPAYIVLEKTLTSYFRGERDLKA